MIDNLKELPQPEKKVIAKKLIENGYSSRKVEEILGIELRLKLLKPVLGKIPTNQKGWEKLHKRECPKCPWDSKQNTIFPK